VLVPYPSWLNAGDNAWQMTAATLVGLMSHPGPGRPVRGPGAAQMGRKRDDDGVQRILPPTLIVWVLYAFKMGFGEPWISTFIGKPGTVSAMPPSRPGQIPAAESGFIPKFRFPNRRWSTSSLSLPRSRQSFCSEACSAGSISCGLLLFVPL
jgi:Amt family ammonium transporter